MLVHRVTSDYSCYHVSSGYVESCYFGNSLSWLVGNDRKTSRFWFVLK